MYTECVTCEKLGKECDGANLLTMSPAELSEWCRMRADHLHISYEKLSEQSGISKPTISRLLSGKQVDFRYESARMMVRVLIGGEFEGNPCPYPPSRKDESSEMDIEKLREENERLRRRIEEVKEDKKKNIDFLKVQLAHEHETSTGRKRLCIIFVVLLLISLSLIIAALLVDRYNSGIGFLWLDRLSALYDAGYPVTEWRI